MSKKHQTLSFSWYKNHLVILAAFFTFFNIQITCSALGVANLLKQAGSNVAMDKSREVAMHKNMTKAEAGRFTSFVDLRLLQG